VRDARAQALPLVGGGEHDWAYLLGGLGRLRYDQVIAVAIRLLGAAIYASSVVLGFRDARTRSSTEESARVVETA
jgi:hypothetical protein